LEAELRHRPDLVLLDLTTDGRDYEAFFSVLEGATPRVPVLGFTTHVLARRTQPMHARCDRVVTRETLTQELGSILTNGMERRESTMPPAERATDVR
jgi:CheY-like chemotaxis protein